MVDIFLTIFCFSGFVYASSRWLKIDLSYAPIFSASLMGVLLFIFAISNQLQKGTLVLIFSGFVFSLFWVAEYLKKRKTASLEPLFRVSTIFIALIIISFILTLQMTFTVVDDYVYWGIMGKYLYINNHLPVAGCPLDTRILAYTPGTSLFHYFFYLLAGKYSVHISYFAQNINLISALFVVVKKENIKKSIVYMSGLIILMTVFYGSIFTKLQVDYLLSIICFSIFWIYYNEKNIHLKLLTISMPICFLFLIKEIGFVLGLLIIAVIFFDIFVDNKINIKKKLGALGFLLLTGAAFFLLKSLWLNHVSAMGFVEFHNAINWDSIKNTFHIFSDSAVQKGFFLFIKEAVIGSADRLNLPYLFWYILIVFLWFKIFKRFQNKENSRFVLFSGLVLLSFFGYLFLLYCMQIIIFQVGNTSDHTIGFSRYLNILFSQIIFIIIITFIHTIILKKRKIGRKICIGVIGIVLLVLGFSRFEIYLHRENQDIQIQKVSQQIENKINNDINSIGIITGRSDNIPNLQFLYYLLPNKVDYKAKINKDENALIHHIKKYDYIILYNPEPLILDWLKPYIEKESRSQKISLLRVRQEQSGNELPKKFSLERILL